MKMQKTLFAGLLTGTLLALGTAPVFAHDRDYDGDRWEHHHRHHDHRGWGWGYGYRPAYVPAPPVVYEQAYVAPPPRVVYREAYPVYRSEPAITVGIGLPPIVIPLR